MVEEKNPQENKGICCFIVNKIINIEGLFNSGEVIFFLILGSIAIEKWLEVCSNIPNITARAIGYSATMLISIYLVLRGFDLIFEEKKNG